MSDDQSRDLDWMAAHFKRPTEEILLTAGQEHLALLRTDPTTFRHTWKDLQALKHRGDFYYDSPDSAVVYAWSYHLKRVQEAVVALYYETRAQVLRGQAIEIIDIGAGTGAVLWGVAAIALALDSHGVRARLPIRILECDASAFMIQFGNTLWDRLRSRFPRLATLVKRELPLISSWDRVTLASPQRPWITASHLLHASDANDRELMAHDGEVASSLARIADRHNASKIITWHSTSKTGPMRTSLASLRDSGWLNSQVSVLSRGFTEADAKCTELEVEIQTRLEETSRHGYWTAHFPTQCLALERSSQEDPELFADGTRIHSLLDDDQRALIERRPHALFRGAAGSGKTLVLVRRLSQIIESSESTRDRRVLVTCFNKEVIDYIRRELLRLGHPDTLFIPRSTGQASGIQPIGWWTMSLGCVKIQAYNFDKLPWRLGAINDEMSLTQREVERRCMLIAQRMAIKLKNITGQWVRDEMRLILYGRSEGIPERYIDSADRSGRGRVVRLDKTDRESLYAEIEREFKATSQSVGPATFEEARLRLLRWLEADKGTRSPAFTDMVVDEAQDITKTDWRILNLLADPKAAWTICWDRTQAIRTGSVFDTPQQVIQSLKPVKSTKLLRAYRVPRPVARFANIVLKSLSFQSGTKSEERSNDDAAIHEMEPQLHALPGPRPIIVYGEDRQSLVKRTVSILDEYAQARPDYRLGPTLIGNTLDTDECMSLRTSLTETLRTREGWQNVRVSDVLQVKGVEFETVIWWADVPLKDEERWAEHLFTFLTRTRGLLVVAFTSSVHARARSFLGYIATKHPELARWTLDAKAALSSLTPAVQPP